MACFQIITDTFQNLLIKNPPKHPLLTGTVSKEFQDALVVVDPPGSGKVDRVRLWLYCRRLVRQLNYENMEAALAECVNEYDNGIAKSPIFIFILSPTFLSFPYTNAVDRVKFLFEDINYFVPHYNFASITAQQGAPTFLYQFEYDGIGHAYAHPPNRFGHNDGRKQQQTLRFSSFRFGTPPEWTPKHVQDLVYLFGQNMGIFTAKDRRLQRLHSALFANFIANGTPNGGEIRNARQFRPELFNYYRIDFANQQNWTELAGDTPGKYHKRAVQFWNEKMEK